MQHSSRRVIAVAVAAFVFSSAAYAQEFVQQGPRLAGTGSSGSATKRSSVALSADGRTALYGVAGDANSVGAAWVFTLSNGIWSQQGPKLVGTGYVGTSNQGVSVALSADGNTAAVGGPGDSSPVGAVWIFVRTGTTWAQQGPKLVGSPGIHATQGQSLALSADGNTLLVGGGGDDFPSITNGGAWVFTRSGDVWTQQVKLNPSVPAGGSWAKFGTSVALSADGSTAVVGGPGFGPYFDFTDNFAGAAWVFTRTGVTWSELGAPLAPTDYNPSVPPKFGYSTAISGDGTIIAVGGPRDPTPNGTGSVWTFRRDGSTFSQMGSKFSGTGAVQSDAWQGFWVALSGDGSILLEGSVDPVLSGAMWAFTRSGDTWTPLGDKIAAVRPYLDINVYYGWGVAISSDGLTALAGVASTSGVGAPNVFTRARPLLPPHAAADFDGDHLGDATIVRSNGDWSTLGSASGFTASSTVHFDAPGIRVRGDFDGDGRQDPASFDPATGLWHILTSSSNFSSALEILFHYGSDTPVPADYDGDGITDIAVYNRSVGRWRFCPSSDPSLCGMFSDFGSAGDIPVPGLDFDGDFRADQVLYNQHTGVWTVMPTQGPPVLSISWGGSNYTLVPGDYDGDRKADLGLYDRATGGWHILTSTSGYTTPITANWGGPGYLPVPADYDGDGVLDVGVYHADTGNWYVLRSMTSFTTSMTIAGFGSASGVPLSSAILPSGGDVLRAGDHDGDGRSEITVYHTTSGMWSSLTSASGFTNATSRSWGGSGYTAAPGDYDGDGETDLGLYDGATGWWYVLLSGANFTTSLAKNVGGPGWSMVPGDYDGDGMTDFAVYNTSTGQWYGLESSTNYTTTFSVNYGGSGYVPVAADYDLDGRTDLGVYHATTGVWSILLSSTGYTTSLGASCGGSGWTPVPADYDGDGKADMVVYNENTGQWYGLTSSGNFASTINVMWGGSGYRPVKGDYDGDGKADFATYVSSSGMWYILLSGGNSIVRAWGGVGDVAIPQYP